MQSRRPLNTLAVNSPNILIARYCVGKLETNENELRHYIHLLTEEREAIKEHGLTAFLLTQLKRDADSLLTDSQRLNINRYLRNLAASAIKKRSQLLKICKVLNQHEIRYIVSKGSIWSLQYYEDPRQRPFTDVDILVEEHNDNFRDAITELGYDHIPIPPAPLVNAQYTIYDQNCQLIPIDAHIRLCNATVFRPVLTFERLWQNHQKIMIEDEKIPVLSDFDAMIHAIIHRTAHNYNEDKLIWLLDMVMISNSWQSEKWQQLRALSYELGIGIIADEHINLLLRLKLINDVSVQPINIQHPRRERLGEELLKRTGDYSPIKRLITNLKGLETIRERINYAKQMAIPDPTYMQKQYGTGSGLGLIIAYIKRLLKPSK